MGSQKGEAGEVAPPYLCAFVLFSALLCMFVLLFTVVTTGVPDRYAFGQRVARRRRELNLKQTDVRDRARLDTRTLRGIETGQLPGNPHSSTLAKLDEALELVPGSAARSWAEGTELQPLPKDDPGTALGAVVRHADSLRQEWPTLAKNDVAAGTDKLNQLASELKSVQKTVREGMLDMGAHVTVLLESSKPPGTSQPQAEKVFAKFFDPDMGDEALYRAWYVGRAVDIDIARHKEFQRRAETSPNRANW